MYSFAAAKRLQLLSSMPVFDLTPDEKRELSALKELFNPRPKSMRRKERDPRFQAALGGEVVTRTISASDL